MGDMIAIGVVLATFIGLAIITAFIEAETVGYADWLPGWLLHRAAKKLPDGERDRWLEEWLADLNQLPKAPCWRGLWSPPGMQCGCGAAAGVRVMLGLPPAPSKNGTRPVNQ